MVTKHNETKTHIMHAMDIRAALDVLGASQSGLGEADAQERRNRDGLNQLAEAPLPSRWRKLLNQFKDLVIWILIFAAIIAGLVGEWPDTVAILAIVLLNALIGFFQEERAEKAIAALRKMSSPMALVLRDGQHVQIPASQLARGDIVELEAGDNIPADVRLLQTFQFAVQEASLTGESLQVDKNASGVLRADTPLADRSNMAYMGTLVVTGKAKAVVANIGMQTEIGKIAGLLHQHEPETTPLQKRLAQLGRILVAACLVIVGVIFAIEMLRGGDFMEVLLVSICLAVAAVPEGLPAVVTIALALGLQRMVRRKARIRKLASVETLGSVTVICSDKTGTLTKNEMTVREIATGNAIYTVSGTGYEPSGTFSKTRRDGEAEQVDVAAVPDLQQTLTVGIRCNGARVVRETEDARWKIIGDPTEGALVVAAMKASIAPNPEEGGLLFEIPFDSDRKVMSVAMVSPDGAEVLYTKGAPEVLLAKCDRELVDGDVRPLTDERREQIMEANSQMAARALRVLALGYRYDLDRDDEASNESNLIFAGLAGMIDPPRAEVKVAVNKCRTAGIRPVMITGDHPATALAIAKELGIADQDAGVRTGVELNAMTDDDIVQGVKGTPVYARVTAAHKLRIVRAWKSLGQVVAMTGDGVNDAPAVKEADIGIAMGITGTPVTQDASDMVLMDDNFSSIVNAVEEGRGIFDNIQKFVHYLLSCNAGEVILMFVATLLGWPVPLVAIQILWINLVTDGLPALALGMEPPERDIMTRAPRPPHEPVTNGRRGLLIFFHGTLVAVSALTAFWLTYLGDESRLPLARTVTFSVVAFSQLFFSIGCRSQKYTMPQLGFLANPYLFGAIAISGALQVAVLTIPAVGPVFEVVPAVGDSWPMILLLSLAPVTIVEAGKLIRSSTSNNTNAT